jgi:glycosyltransferase involved in cell wall biosynthesis
MTIAPEALVAALARASRAARPPRRWPRLPITIGYDASRALRPQRSGTERYALHLLRALLALDRRNRYVLYADREPPVGLLPAAANAGWRVIRAPRLWTQGRLAADLALWTPDVLFVPAHALPWWCPTRSVVTVHDLGFYYVPHAYRPFDRWYLHVSTYWSARRATRVLADSLATRDDLVRWYGVSSTKIDVVHLGVDAAFRPQPAEARRVVAARYGLDRPYLLYVGALRRRKNLPRLLVALARLRARPLLALAGSAGPDATVLRDLAMRLGLGDDVRILGYVPEDDLPALYSGALAVVLPSLYEGFGLTALEAMACGVPVVCARVGALPEVVGDAGLLLDPHDVPGWTAALERISGDTPLRADLGARGRARAAAFTWERCALLTLHALLAAAGV